MKRGVGTYRRKRIGSSTAIDLLTGALDTIDSLKSYDQTNENITR